MNIWYVHPYGGGPGVGRFFRPWILAKEWKKQGHVATVFVARYHHLLDHDAPLPEEMNIEGVRYVGLKARAYKGNGVGRILNMWDFCRAIWKLRHRVGKDLQKPDAIIFSSPHPFGIYPARWLARRFGAKLAFEVRDLWPLSITEINGTPKWHPFVMLCGLAERYAYRTADVVASLLPGVDQYVAQCGIKLKIFVWVPNGIDDSGTVPLHPTSEVGKRADALIDEWHLQGRKVIIHPGAMGPPNGLQLLLQATQIFNEIYAAERLGVLLLGEGSLKSTLMARAANDGLNNVAFADPVAKQEARWLLQKCDIGYAGGLDHPAVYRFGISFNKIMDFMEVGLPVIIPFKAYMDPISESGGGICVPDGDPAKVAAAILKLSQTKAETALKRALLAKQYAIANFNYQIIAKNYAKALFANGSN